MKEKLKDLWDKFKLQYTNLNPKLKKRIFIIAFIVIAFSVGTALFLNNKPYEPLFSGLNQEEATEIMGKLQEMGVEYKYSNDGEISVTNDQVDQVKAELVYAGYPKSGFTYDIFKDNVSMMSTDFEKNSYKLYELQDRIAATIRLFDGVSDAKVTIAATEDNKYVLNSNSEQKSQASVVVIMKNGGSPTEEQVKGIQRLVSKSIPNMEMTEVVVLDGNGNDVSPTDDSSSIGANKLKLEFEKHMDDSIRAKILTVLSPIYGADNVRVSVRTTVNVDKTIREITNYDAADEENQKGIPSSESEQTEVVRGADAAGGVPGAETNADIPTYSQVDAGDENNTYYNNQSDIDYLVNQLKEQSQIDSGSIDDMSVSVTINGETIGDISEKQLKSLIGNAAGIAQNIQNEKIAVVAAPFYDNSTPAPITDEDGKNNWIIIGAIASGALLILLVIIILIVGKRKKKKAAQLGNMNLDELKKHSKKSQEAYIKELMQKQQEDKENQILNLTNERGLELKNKVREIAEENPEISAQLIRNWLKGGE